MAGVGLRGNQDKSVKCGVWSVRCEVWTLMRSVRCGVESEVLCASFVCSAKVVLGRSWKYFVQGM